MRLSFPAHRLRLLLACLLALCWPSAAQSAQALDPDHWHYVASNDGLGHWLYLTADAASVNTPFGVLEPLSVGGRVPLNLDMACRQGSDPLLVELVFPAPRSAPAAVRTLSLRNFLVAVHRHAPAGLRGAGRRAPRRGGRCSSSLPWPPMWRCAARRPRALNPPSLLILRSGVVTHPLFACALLSEHRVVALASLPEHAPRVTGPVPAVVPLPDDRR